MKKTLRLLLIVLGSLALLLALVVALAFTPGVQTWAAKKFAPATPELTVAIGRVDAGLSRTRVENVRVVQPGLVLTLPSAEIDVGVLDALGGKVDVKRLVARGWILDLAAPAAGPTKSASSPRDSADTFNGVFKDLVLPVDLSVDGVDLAGEVLLPDARAQVAVTGGGLSAGSEGVFDIVADLKAPDASLSTRSRLAVRMASPRTLDRVSLKTDAAARGPQVPQGASVTLALDAARAGDAETYAVAVSAAQRDLLRVDVSLPAGAAPLSGTWSLDATRADAAPFALGAPLPDFAAKGKGTFTADRSFTHVAAAGALDASLEKLAEFQPGLAAVGRLTLAAAFDVATEGDLVRLNKLEARVAGAKPVASLVALQPVSFNPATAAVSATDPAADLLRLDLDGVPLAWAAPFLGDIALSGDDLRGAFVVKARDGGFAVRPAAPVTLANLSVSQAGKPLVSRLDLALSSQATYTPSGLTAEITDLSVSAAGAPLAKLAAKAVRNAGDDQPLAATGTYELSLPAVLAQPAAAGSAALKAGVARGEFSASVSDRQTASLTLQLDRLAAADGTALPAVALQARAEVAASGVITAQVPVVITQAKRRSDVTLSATVTPGEKVTDIRARLASDLLQIPDLQLFAAAIPPAPAQPASAAAGTAPSAPAGKPQAPLWDGVTGELQLALKKVVYSKELQLDNIAGSVKITPAALTLENLVAALRTGGALKAGGGLSFDAKQDQPYGLQADLAFTRVEAEPLLRALSPGKPAPVEGRFDLATRLSGRAVEPAGFGETVIGDIKLTGKDGTLKALNVKTSAAVDNVGKAAAFAGLIGQLAGSESTIKYADRARAAADVTKQFAALQFDRLNVVLARDEKNNLGIKDLSLLSPVINLAGSGQITYQPGVPLVQQPMLLTLQLAAKDKLAADLRTLKLLSDKTDASGYAALVEKLTFDGTLQAVGTSQLSNLINRALTN